MSHLEKTLDFNMGQMPFIQFLYPLEPSLCSGGPGRLGYAYLAYTRARDPQGPFFSPATSSKTTHGNKMAPETLREKGAAMCTEEFPMFPGAAMYTEEFSMFPVPCCMSPESWREEDDAIHTPESWREEDAAVDTESLKYPVPWCLPPPTDWLSDPKNGSPSLENPPAVVCLTCVPQAR